jgi:hypothetical protein
VRDKKPEFDKDLLQSMRRDLTLRSGPKPNNLKRDAQRDSR